MDDKLIKDFWDRLRIESKKKHISLGNLSEIAGLERSTLSWQRANNKLPNGVAIYDLENYLGTKLFCVSEWDEYIDYLKKADEWKLKAIRQLLEMPDSEKKSDSFSKVG